MHLKKINELAVILEKVNYLYRNIRKSNEAPKKIELALLKRYVTDFYDGLLELDVPAGAFLATQVSSEQQHVAKVAVAEEKKSEVPPVAATDEVVQEKQPLAAIANNEEVATNEEEKEAPWVATMSEKFTSIKEAVAEKTETVKESLSEKVSHISEELPVWKDKAADMLEATKDSMAEKAATIKEMVSEKMSNITEHLPAWKDKVADIKDSVSEKISHLTNKKDNDDTDKPPVFERIKDTLSHEYKEENDESVRTMVLENKSLSGQVSMPTDTDDETVAIDAQKATPLIEALRNSKAPESGSGGGKNIFPINFNQRYAFVNRLFDGDEAAYGKAINDLSESKGYIEALTYVNLNLRYDYKWRDDDPTVKEFLDIIKHTFLD